ncbi:MAG: P-loop NTPase [Halobacteriales archaeon]
MTGHVYAVASGKGGVGKTTTVVNLGVMLRAEGHSVALVDADLGMPNLANMIGVDHQPTLHDVLADEATIDAAINEESEGFGIIQGTRDLSGFARADPSGLQAVVEELADRYEYVLLDTGPGLSHEDVLPLGIADEVILVTTPNDVSIGDVEKTDELVDIVDGITAGVVITHANQDTDPERIGDLLETTVLGVIPEDNVVPQSIAASQPLEAFDPDSRAAAAYRRLAARLIEANAPNVEALSIDELNPADPPAVSATSDGDERPESERETTPSGPEAPTIGTDSTTSTDTAGSGDDESGGDEDGPDDEADDTETAAAVTDDSAGDEPKAAVGKASDIEQDSEPETERESAQTEDETHESEEVSEDREEAEESSGRGGLLGWVSRRFS